MTSFQSQPPDRDFVGHGRDVPYADWPGKARIAIQFILNYEEGAERCILNGDETSEAFLSDIVNAEPWPGQRHMNIESLYEYGTRAGFWRLWRLFTARQIPVSVNAVAQALVTAPEQIAAMTEANWEISSHALRWIDYKDVPRDEERAQMHAAIKLHAALTGTRPAGWYTGRTSVNTLDLVVEEGGFLYSSDSYADDLPYWLTLKGRKPHLIVPYAMDTNDMRFSLAQGYQTADDFFVYLRDAFDVLYAEGAGLSSDDVDRHALQDSRPPGSCRRAHQVSRLYRDENEVWITRRDDLARHWHARHPAITR